MLLVQNDIIDLFLANFQLDISELTRETFFLVSVFVEVGNSEHERERDSSAKFWGEFSKR